MDFLRRWSGVDDAWTGVVERKKRASDGQNIHYRLIVVLDDGTTKRVRVRRSLWMSCQVGDHLVKTAGERFPVKDV